MLRCSRGWVDGQLLFNKRKVSPFFKGGLFRSKSSYLKTGQCLLGNGDSRQFSTLISDVKLIKQSSTSAAICMNAGNSIEKETYFSTREPFDFGKVQSAFDEIVSPSLVGLDPVEQAAADKVLDNLNVSSDLKIIWPEVLSSLSASVARTGAAATETTLLKHLASLSGGGINDIRAPTPVYNGFGCNVSVVLHHSTFSAAIETLEEIKSYISTQQVALVRKHAISEAALKENLAELTFCLDALDALDEASLGIYHVQLPEQNLRKLTKAFPISAIFDPLIVDSPENNDSIRELKRFSDSFSITSTQICVGRPFNDSLRNLERAARGRIAKTISLGNVNLGTVSTMLRAISILRKQGISVIYSDPGYENMLDPYFIASLCLSQSIEAISLNSNFDPRLCDQMIQLENELQNET